MYLAAFLLQRYAPYSVPINLKIALSTLSVWGTLLSFFFIVSHADDHLVPPVIIILAGDEREGLEMERLEREGLKGFQYSLF